MNINIRQLKKWIAALDSGEYQQGGGCLQYRDTYCCLGVACIVLVADSQLKKIDGVLTGGIASDQFYAPQWLKDISDDFESKTEISLLQLNDDEGYTFPEIATLLELVYIHKILD